MPADAHPAHVPVAEVTRGAVVESVHQGSVAVVDRAGRVLHAAGDPHALVFTRSSLKPLQALPFVSAGGPARFGYSEAVADMLARARVHGNALLCGTQVPGFYDTLGRTPPPPPYSPLQHNCSGKYAGMLAWCPSARCPSITRSTCRPVRRTCGRCSPTPPTARRG